MTSADSDARAGTRSGVAFAVLFPTALTVLLGDLVGAFADSPTTFTYFDDSAGRLRHALGAVVLTAAGLSFMSFVVHVTTASDATGPDAEGRVARHSAAVFAALVGLAAAAFATVSLSIGFGRITGDPGIQATQELLPQLGYVVLFVPAALSAGLTVLLVTRSAARASLIPRWLVGAGYLTAAAQLFSFYALPLVLLPLWVLGAAVCLGPTGPITPRRRARR